MPYQRYIGKQPVDAQDAALIQEFIGIENFDSANANAIAVVSEDGATITYRPSQQVSLLAASVASSNANVTLIATDAGKIRSITTANTVVQVSNADVLGDRWMSVIKNASDGPITIRANNAAFSGSNSLTIYENALVTLHSDGSNVSLINSNQSQLVQLPVLANNEGYVAVSSMERIDRMAKNVSAALTLINSSGHVCLHGNLYVFSSPNVHYTTTDFVTINTRTAALSNTRTWYSGSNGNVIISCMTQSQNTAYSLDGITWTLGTSIPNQFGSTPASIFYLGGAANLWLTQTTGTGTRFYVTSPGHTQVWTSRAGPYLSISCALYKLNDIAVFVPRTEQANVGYSLNGVSWTIAPTPGNVNITGDGFNFGGWFRDELTGFEYLSFRNAETGNLLLFSNANVWTDTGIVLPDSTDLNARFIVMRENGTYVVNFEGSDDSFPTSTYVHMGGSEWKQVQRANQLATVAPTAGRDRFTCPPQSGKLGSYYIGQVATTFIRVGEPRYDVKGLYTR